MCSDPRYRRKLGPNKVWRPSAQRLEFGEGLKGAKRIRKRHMPATYISELWVSTWFGTFLIKPK
jgi:hypothetical protein